MKDIKKVALIIDNPLRDLDGLILIAYFLSKYKIVSYIIPMHLQEYDVFGLNPDLILVNYVRNNNCALLQNYHEAGIKVSVLDTEGAGGSGWAETASLISSTQAKKYVDHYFTWGESQKNLLIKYDAISSNRISAVGCPRYDFISPFLKNAIESVDIAENYFLINTNFPILNPRFSAGTKDEINNWITVGLDGDKANKYATACRRAYEGVKDAVRVLSNRFPNETFIIRPHPFEKCEAYSDLADLENVKIRQEGTSLCWLKNARALLHLNCSTALEATFMGIEAISFEWLNDPAIRHEDVIRISRKANDINELIKYIDIIVERKLFDHLPDRENIKNHIIDESYLKLDGFASSRVAQTINTIVMEDKSVMIKKRKNHFSKRYIISIARKILGFKISEAIKMMISKDKSVYLSKENKIPNLEVIRRRLACIALSQTDSFSPEANIVSLNEYTNPKMASGKIIKIQ